MQGILLYFVFVLLLSPDVNRGIILFSLLCETMRLEVSIEITFVDSTMIPICHNVRRYV